MYLGDAILGAYMLIMFMSSWLILPFSTMKCLSGYLFWPLFWSIFSLIVLLLPQLFPPCAFACNICFQPFTISLCMSFVLRWISCRQHMSGSCFLIHLATLCLLIGAFNPLYLRLLLIGTYSLPLFHTGVPLSLSLFFFLFLRKTLYHLLQSWFGGGVFFEASFVWETPYLDFHLNWEPCC